MLTAIRRFGSSLSSLTHLTRTAGPGRRSNLVVGIPALVGERQTSVLTAVGAGVPRAGTVAQRRRNIHGCSSGSRYSAKRGTPIKSRKRRSPLSRQIELDRSLATMEPTVAEFFPDVEKHHTLEVTSGAHPIVDLAFEKVLETVSNAHDKRLKDFPEWIRKVIEYNVPQGKRNRLVAVMLAYQSLEKDEITSDGLEKAAILGWCVELLQAFFLICDDIMDNSSMRRGRKCWYLVDGVNMMAINDSILCEAAIYHILKTFFRTHPNYVHMMELFHEVTLQTASGQSLDLLSERKGGSFTEDTHDSIVIYKTAYYSFALPIRLGMYLAGISDEASHKECEKIALRIGHIFQVQDDYLDCYGDPEVVGKVGTDIVDAKCSWLVVKALQIAKPQERKLLLSFYGKGSGGGPDEIKVKEIYKQLKMDEVFREAEDRAFAVIKDEVEKLDRADTPLSSDIFKLLVNKIYRRNK